jgi:hypothetical protein
MKMAKSCLQDGRHSRSNSLTTELLGMKTWTTVKKTIGGVFSRYRNKLFIGPTSWPEEEIVDDISVFNCTN